MRLLTLTISMIFYLTPSKYRADDTPALEISKTSQGLSLKNSILAAKGEIGFYPIHINFANITISKAVICLTYSLFGANAALICHIFDRIVKLS